jgi:iron complex outermembrane recepter protein
MRKSLTLFVLFFTLVYYQTGNALSYDVQSQEMESALRLFSEQSGAQIIFTSESVKNKLSFPLNGEFSVTEALTILLRESDLAYTEDENGVIIIYPFGTKGKTDQIDQQGHDKAEDISQADNKNSNIESSTLEDHSNVPTLEEVIITARKREESLMDTPVSITVFSNEKLDAMNLISIDQIAGQTPGMVFDSTSNISGSSNSSSIFIRGIGQRDYTLAIEPGVGLYVDDVYLAHSIGNVLDIVDVERIEVLRGPQGTLFGRNTIGGAVRLVTRKPHEKFEGDVEFGLGSFQRIDLKGHINIPLSENLFTRFSALGQNRDGFVDRVFLGGKSGDKDSSSFVAQARWIPDDDFTADILLAYTRDRSNGAPTILLSATPGIAGSGPEIFRTQVAPALSPEINNNLFSQEFIGWNGDNCPCTDFSDSIIQQDLDTYSAAITLDWHFSDDMALKSISSFRDLKSHFGRDGDHVPEIQQVNLEFFTEYQQWSEEFQLSGRTLENRIEWILGAYYYYEEGVSTDDIRFVTQDLVSGGNFETENFAVFGQGTYHFTSRLNLTVGLRYTNEEKKATIDENHQIITAVLGNAAFKMPVNANISLVGGMQKVIDNIEETDPYVNLSYQWQDNLLLYASYSEGFKGGGVQVRIGGGINFLPRFDPEFAKVYELGAKWSLFDGRLNLSGAGFFTDYSDLQITANVTPSGGPPTSVVTNAGDAEITGFELEFAALPTENLHLNGGISYLHARYTNLLSAPGVTLDNKLPNAPEYQLNLSASYTIHSAYGSFTPRIDYSHTAEQFNDAQNNRLLNRDSTNMLNISLAYQSSNELWGGALYVTNALDEQVILAGFDGGFYGDGVVSRPAEWGLRIVRSF